jgi:hypothetical protein
MGIRHLALGPILGGFLLAGCGSEPSEDVTQADLQGNWIVSWCQLRVTITEATASWSAGNCPTTPAGGVVEVGPVVRLLINENQEELYEFSNFSHADDGLRSDFLGACDNPLPGGGPGCRRDAGEAAWTRAVP